MAEKHRESMKRYKNLDVLKCICAFLVVCIHSPFPGEVGKYIVAIARISVPIFFMITGFFFTDVSHGNRQINKAVKLIIISNILYFLFYSALVLYKGGIPSLFDYYYNKITPKNIANMILFNESPFAGHLWYLNAMLYVLLIGNLLVKYGQMTKAYNIIFILLAIDLIFGKYSLLIWRREYNYLYIRNFLFVGLPYFLIGNAIQKNIDKLKHLFNRKTTLCLLCLFTFTTIIERYLLVINGINAQRDHYISTSLLAVIVFLSALFLSEVRGGGNVLAYIGLRHSTNIYIVHYLFMVILNALPRINNYSIFGYAKPFLIFFISIFASEMIIKLSSKIKYRGEKNRSMS